MNKRSDQQHRARRPRWKAAVTSLAVIIGIVGLDASPAHALGEISISDAAIAEGTGGATTAMVFTLTISDPNPIPITVDYATSPGTATPTEDYITQSSVATFDATETTTTIEIPIVHDDVAEPNETFFVVLSNPSGGSTLADDTAVGTILNDDGVPPKFAISDASVTESESTVTASATLTLTPASDLPTSVDFATVAGTATSDVDYQLTAATVEFAAGQTTVDIDVDVFGDTLDEADEFFDIVLSNASNAAIGDDKGRVTIFDNDDQPSLSVDDPSVGEGDDGSTPMTYTVSLSAASGRTVSVDYATFDGTATNGSDYTSTSGTLIFAPSETSKTVDVSVLGDTSDESDETVLLILSGADAATISDSQGTGTIVDDDASPTISIGDVEIAEGDDENPSAELTVTLSEESGRAIVVDFTTVDGTATAGTDFTATSDSVTFEPGSVSEIISIPILSDTLPEADEIFTVTLSNPQTAAIVDGAGEVTILDDDEDPLISASSATVTEGDSGTFEVVFDVTLSDVSGQTITAQVITQDVTTTAGFDFNAVNKTLVYEPGETEKTVTVTIFGDTLDEVDETFLITWGTLTNARPGTDGVGEILDDDEQPTISIDDQSTLEGADTETVDLFFTITLSEVSGRAVTVDVATADDTATAGDDYVAASGTATIPEGATTVQVAVTVNGDDVAELDEAFEINLSNPAGATIVDGNGVGDIFNDDGPLPAIAIGDVSVIEGDEGTTEAVFNVSLTPSSAGTVLVDYTTVAGTATADVDYTTMVGQLEFAPGQTARTIIIPVIGDLIDELDEMFTVELSNPQNAKLVEDGDVGEGTILDDDTGPGLSIVDTEVIEGTGGTTAGLVTLELTEVSGQAISGTVSTSDGTAVSPDDFTATSDAAFEIPAGQLTGSVELEIVADAERELAETFGVTIESVVGASVETGSATATIVDDDALGTFHPMDGTKLADTTRGSRLQPGETLAVSVAGMGGIPADGVRAVALQIFAEGPSGDGELSVTRNGSGFNPHISFAANRSIANHVIAPLGSGGKVRIKVSAASHVVVFAQGWYAKPDGPVGAGFTPLESTKVLDSRRGVGVDEAGRVGSQVKVEVPVLGVGDVPADGVDAVLVRVSAVGAFGTGSVAAYRADGPKRRSLDFTKRERASTLVAMPVSSDGKIIVTPSAKTYLVAAVVGYWSTPGTVLDSVIEPGLNVEVYDKTIVGGSNRTVSVAGEGGLPADMVGAVLMVRLDAPNKDGFLSVVGSSGKPQTIEIVAGRDVMSTVVVPLDDLGQLRLRLERGRTDVTVNVIGTIRGGSTGGELPTTG